MTTEMKKQSDKNSGFIDTDHGYECKTCKKRFNSYQALGGHQGVHKRIKRSLLSLTGFTNSDKSTTMIVEHLEENSGFTDSDHGYECKTCKKIFNSYQALGGHQGVHKKIKLSADYDAALCLLSLTGVFPTVSSGLHRCKMCKIEFETGQALGGHMRQHRLEKVKKKDGKFQEVTAKGNVESDSLLTTMELHQHKEEEDEQIRIRRELILAAKELQLGF